ncbi:putative quinol monooxygenase [Amycolatopsis pithecellobii]|uniref:Antibiotic biosynthesis monooxygenase n=1 Tax=Amycolatopsis pithecellobii TaxID=664692 RepID=A0A6N7YUB3_9PSEU|nr:putative quinol monooxygenase [Amycolatopsis pithecellobii]MTD55512.1 antibiotic biosynthesis monooxygenase [Amycolatopsis pithecellobii]
MIHVIAIVTAHPGKRQAILDELHAKVPLALAEEGCIEYTVTVDADVVGPMHTQTKFGEDTIIIIEKWESLDHLEAHSTAPHVEEYFSVVNSLMASRVVHFLSSTR